MPVPAPGTAEILKGIPLADVPIEAELTTPTGAAIVKTLADRFGSMPAMTIESIGCGCGTKNFPERANVLRIFIGTANVPATTEHVVLLETNLDDVTGETIGHVRERLNSVGALDVFVTPIQMKKDRPGVILSVLCRPEKADRCEDIVFTETGTLGIRRLNIQRSVQQREEVDVETPWGPVRGKIGRRAGHPPTFAPEFEDCARVARDRSVPLRDVYRAAEASFVTLNQAHLAACRLVITCTITIICMTTIIAMITCGTTIIATTMTTCMTMTICTITTTCMTEITCMTVGHDGGVRSSAYQCSERLGQSLYVERLSQSFRALPTARVAKDLAKSGRKVHDSPPA